MTSTVVLVGLVSLCTDISSESVSAVLPIYLTAVAGLSPLAYGFIDGLYQGVSALVRILGGWLGDRTDHPKWVAAVGYGLSAVSKIVLITSGGMAALTSAITVDRLGKGVRTAPRDALIAASSPPESLGRAFGVHRALDTAGAVIGPVVAFAVLYAVPGDYRGVFVVSFAAALVGLALLVLVVPDLRPRRAAAAGRLADPSPLAAPSLRLLADRRLLRVVLTALLLGVLTIGDGFVYLALADRWDLAGQYFPLLYVGTNIAYLALAVPFGRLADRVGRGRVFLAGHLALALVYLGVGLAPGGLAVGVACLLLLGTYYAATDGVLAALTGHLVPVGARGSGIATTQTTVAAARFVSSLGFGLLWTQIGQQPAMIVVAVGLMAAWPVAWLLLRPVDAQLRTAREAG